MESMFLKLRLALLLIILSALNSLAIVMRHDRDISQYSALGERFKSVCSVRRQTTCTLISPNWVITAAHVIEGFPPFTELFVTFGDKQYPVEKILIHPSRARNTIDSSADIALFKLKIPVEGIKPVLLYEKNDEAEKLITLVGYGRTGNGLTGPTGEKVKVPLGATNRIEAHFENSLVITFDLPPGGTELEGIGGAGDSGGPALLEKNNDVYLLGVASFNNGDETTTGRYGTFAGYARISTRRQWILNTMAADPPTSGWRPLDQVNKSDKSFVNVAKRRAEAFLSAFNSSQLSKMAEFYKTQLVADPRGRSPEERIKYWQELFDNYGQYQARDFLADGRSRFAVRVYATKTKEWRAVVFELSDKVPHKITDLYMGNVSPPK